MTTPFPLAPLAIVDEHTGAIRCPSCREFSDMHPIEVRVGMREEDDEKSMLVAITKTSMHCTVGKVTDSARRSAVSIVFECFACGGAQPQKYVLTLSHHKGLTLTNWRKEAP